MGTNRTSLAIESIAKAAGRDKEWNASAQYHRKYVQAIAKKYRKMEEALEELAFDNSSQSLSIAQEALDFDPLDIAN